MCMKMQSIMIYAKQNGCNDILYLCSQTIGNHYLFSSRHSQLVIKHFQNGVPINIALDYSRVNRNRKLCKCIDRLPTTIRYVLKEYGTAC